MPAKPKPAKRKPAKPKPASAAAPPNLTAAGARAFRRALEHVDEPARFYDVAVTYARAVDREWRIRQAWHDLGEPATELGGARGETVVAHPLLKAMADAGSSILDASRVLGLDPKARQEVGGKRRPGRPQGTDVPPALGARPSDRLRAVK